MSDVQIIMPSGMLGGSADDTWLDTALRVIGVGFGDSGDWCAKYGCNFENDVFLMKRFCWCEKEDGSCLWCLHGDHPDFARLLQERFGTEDYQLYAKRGYYDPPNFWFKPSDFRVCWYKYIGRGMATNKNEIAPDFMAQIFATHPTGMTAEQAIAECARQEEATATEFAKMFSDLGIGQP